MSALLLPNENELLCQIEIELDRFFETMKSQTLAIKWNSEMSQYHFSTGGKRLRALIPCAVFSALGKNPESAIPLGLSLELIHNATLVHDDLQDGDATRRGKETVWKKYSDVQAINCGDALYQFAIMALEKLETNPSAWRKVAKRLAYGSLQVIEGQAQEFLMKDEPSPNWERYCSVVTGKTAALIATAVTSALEAIEAPSALITAAEKAAIGSGVLFQIQDDLLDIYGEKQRERPATDVAEGKISALVAVVNHVATAPDRERLAEILATPRNATSDGMIQEALGLFDKYEVAQVLIGKIRTIQTSLTRDPDLKRFPEMQRFFSRLNERFLEPIRHLF